MSRDNVFHIYDNPPSVRSFPNDGPPPYSAHPRPPQGSTQSVGGIDRSLVSTQPLGPRRQSWQDLVSENGTATISDLSILNTSYGFGNTQHGSNASMGNRRQSWLNLMESDDNLHRHSMLPTVSDNPGGPPAKPKKPRVLKLFSVTDKGKLKQEKPRNTSLSTSQASTPSEFILVPKAYSNAGPLPRKSPIPEVSISDLGSVSRQNTDGSVERTSPPLGSKPVCAPCTTKRTLGFLVLAALLFVVALIIGLVARHALSGPKTYRYEWTPPGRTPSRVNLVLKDDEQAEVRIEGQFPFQSIKSVVDFKTKKMVMIDLVLPNYCFVSVLNETALPNLEQLERGAENSIDADLNGVEWEKHWYWKVEPLNEQWKSEVTASEIKECSNAASLHLLSPISRNIRGERCIECTEVCFPHYTVAPEPPQGEKLFRIERQNCFWFFVKEWAIFAASGRDRDYSADRWPSSGLTIRPTAPWIQLENRQGQDGVIDLGNAVNAPIRDPRVQPTTTPVPIQEPMDMNADQSGNGNPPPANAGRANSENSKPDENGWFRVGTGQ